MVGREGTAKDDLDWSDEGSKGPSFLFLHYSREPLLDYFSARVGADGCRAQCGVVADVSGELLDVKALVGHTKDPKFVLFLHFTGGDFLGNFSTTVGSSGGVSWLGFVPSGEGNPSKVVEWPMERRVGRAKAGKLIASICF